MLLFGGAGVFAPANDVWSLKSSYEAWDLLAFRFPNIRNSSAVCDPVANELLVFGGEGVHGGSALYRMGLTTPALVARGAGSALRGHHSPGGLGRGARSHARVRRL